MIYIISVQFVLDILINKKSFQTLFLINILNGIRNLQSLIAFQMLAFLHYTNRLSVIAEVLNKQLLCNSLGLFLCQFSRYIRNPMLFHCQNLRRIFLSNVHCFTVCIHNSNRIFDNSSRSLLNIKSLFCASLLDFITSILYNIHCQFTFTKRHFTEFRILFQPAFILMYSLQHICLCSIVIRRVFNCKICQLLTILIAESRYNLFHLTVILQNRINIVSSVIFHCCNCTCAKSCKNRICNFITCINCLLKLFPNRHLFSLCCLFRSSFLCGSSLVCKLLLNSFLLYSLLFERLHFFHKYRCTYFFHNRIPPVCYFLAMISLISLFFSADLFFFSPFVSLGILEIRSMSCCKEEAVTPLSTSSLDSSFDIGICLLLNALTILFVSCRIFSS